MKKQDAQAWLLFADNLEVLLALKHKALPPLPELIRASFRLGVTAELAQKALCQLIGKSIELTACLSFRIKRFADLTSEIMANGVTGKSGTACNLPN